MAPLGAGSMGEVYQAHDLKLRRDVALKLLSAALATSEEHLLRFERESRTASALNHPHICTIYDVGQAPEADGRPYLVMELLRGSTLYEAMASGPLQVSTVVNLGVQVADALDAAHGAGIIHRDLKPANIFVTSRGDAKLLDFGLAAVIAGAADASSAGGQAGGPLTSLGTAVGTVLYMSPEQALGDPLDPRTDIFSLGLVLYEMLTGRRAFEGRSNTAIVDAILHAAPTGLEAADISAVPKELRRLVARMLEKDREYRPSTAAEVAARLRAVQSGSMAGREYAATSPDSSPGSSKSAAHSAETLHRTADSHARPAVVRPQPRAGARQHQGCPDGDPAADAVRRRRIWNLHLVSGSGGSARAARAAAARRLLQYHGRGCVRRRSEGRARNPAPAVAVCESAADVAGARRPAADAAAARRAGHIGRGPRPVRASRREGRFCSAPSRRSAPPTSSRSKRRPAGPATRWRAIRRRQRRRPTCSPRSACAAARIRERLGESIGSIQKFNVPAPNATTPSLDALKAYSMGIETRLTTGDDSGDPLLRACAGARPQLRAGRGAPRGDLRQPARSRAAQQVLEAGVRAQRLAQRARAPVHQVRLPLRRHRPAGRRRRHLSSVDRHVSRTTGCRTTTCRPPIAG